MTYPGAVAASAPDRPAIVMASSGEVVTYRELDERSARLAHLWHERGLRRGDHVAILLENSPRWFDAVWAAFRSGLYFTPVNWHLTAPEVAYIVQDCGARSVLTSVAMAEQVRDLDVEVPLVVGDDLAGWERYEDAVADRPTSHHLDDGPEGQGMYYSSGTTGRPKGILFPLTERTVHDEHPIVTYRSPIAATTDAVYLSPAPLYHTAPVVSCSLVHRVGGTTIVMERWDPERCLAAIERHRCNSAQFVPTMFVRMLKLPAEVRERYDVSSLRQVTHAAAPCPVEVKHQMFEWLGPIIWEYYAGSENAGSTLISPEEWLAHPGSVGLPRMCTVHICDDDHRELPRRRGRQHLVRRAGRVLPVPRRPREDGGRPQPGGLDHDRRRGPARRGRLLVPHRPAVLHDHLGRREHLPPRGRGRARAAPRRGRRGRVRHPRPRPR